MAYKGDSGQKPLEAFTQHELDWHRGEVADFNDEALEIKGEMDWDAAFALLENTLGGILKVYFAERVFDKDVIVVNSKYGGHGSGPADFLAKKYRLHLALHPDFPENEMVVVHRDDIETVIISRVEKAKGFVPSTLLSSVRMS